jgi:hypothetical protein
MDYPILPRRPPICNLDIGPFAGLLIGHGGVRPKWQVGGGGLIAVRIDSRAAFRLSVTVLAAAIV